MENYFSNKIADMEQEFYYLTVFTNVQLSLSDLMQDQVQVLTGLQDTAPAFLDNLQTCICFALIPSF